MKTTTLNKIVSTVTSTILLAGVCELGLAFVPPAINLARAQQAANAATEPTPKVVEISAKKFEFSPSQKFDIGLEFTLLNIKPPDGQNALDNRFLNLFVQSRFGK